MGHFTAVGFAQAVEDGSVNLAQAVHAHLTSNVFPPCPWFTDQATAAVERCAEGDFDAPVALPEGVTFRDGRDTITAAEWVESLRLAAFVQVTDDDPLADHC